MEKFYCVGCKNHYELNLTGLERKPSKGGSFRYAMKSVCPQGHRTSKICNEDDFADYADDLELCPKCGSESWYEEPTDHAYHYDCSCSDCGHTEWKEVDGPDYDDYDDPRYEAETYTYESLGKYNDDELREILTEMNEKSEKKLLSGDLKYGNTQLLKNLILGFQNLDSPYDSLIEPRGTSATPKFRYGAEGMTVGVNLEALAPTADEPESGVALVPEDSLMPEGSGRTIGSQSVSHNYTPFHAEEYCDEYCEENGGHCASCCEHPSCEISDICVLHCDGDYHSGPCMIECGNCDATFSIDEGLDIGGIDYCEECYDTRMSKEVVDAEEQKFPCDSCNQMVSRSDLKVMSGSYDEDYQICRECLTYEAEEEMVGVCDYCSFVQSYAPSNMLLIADNPRLAHDYCKACNSNHPDYGPTDECEDFKPRNPDVYEGNIWFCQGCGSGTDFEVPLSKAEKQMAAEEFIAHRRLKDHLLSVMPDKVYGVKDLGDGDFEMRVADRHMDDVIEAVSEYQISESADSFFLGQSKSTVAAVAAVAALGLAFWYNRK